MLDKEKINKMAGDMQYGCVKHDLWPSDAKEIAKALIILGYQKVKEDEIVISRKKYTDLINQNKNLKKENGQLRLENNDLEVQIENKSKETTERVITFLNYYCDYDSTYLVEQLKKYLAKE